MNGACSHYAGLTVAGCTEMARHNNAGNDDEPMIADVEN